MKKTLPHDGERVVEAAYGATAEGRNILAMHLASYSRALEFCSGKDVLDLGCGSGYGIASLAPHARSVAGVDVSTAAVEYAREQYRFPNLRYEEIIADRPTHFPAESFDVVLSFQVIEHVVDDAAYVAEIHRLLRKGGVALFITPDRRTRLFRWQKPWNRWHLREYSDESLAHVVCKRLSILGSEVMRGEALPVAAELRRYRLARWAALPVTLPFVPETLRFAGLALLSWISTRLQKQHNEGASQSSSRTSYWFERDDHPGLNVLVIAKKS
jgi:SAM-dependent methyltransferase